FVRSGFNSFPLHSSNDIMDPKAVEHVKEILHDKNRVWGQIMDQASQATGLDPEQLAALIGGLISIYLIFGEQARIFANCILIGITLFIYVFAPQEKPKHELMMIYCACYAVSTTLDPALQGSIAAYYWIKVVAHILLFLRPYSLAEKILAMSQLNGTEEKKEGDENDHKLFSKEELKRLFDRKAKSPPPEKPEGEKQKTSTTVSPWPQSSEMNSMEARSPPEDVRTAVSPSVAHQISDKPKGRGWRPTKGRNEMEDSPSPYHLDSSSSNESNARLDGRGVGAYDVEWEPRDRIVYNAPFDYAHLTYHIRMKNVSRFPVAFAIKSNAIPRVTATPATGILKAGKSIYVAVTVQKIDVFDDSLVVKDRIAFEYVRVPEETQKFDFKLLQFSTLKLRKNIHIKYNP
ncbi:hypothetical protein PMAYCL1PPCAC_18506, partial [Pristionchus mayeri]